MVSVLKVVVVVEELDRGMVQNLEHHVVGYDISFAEDQTQRLLLHKKRIARIVAIIYHPPTRGCNPLLQSTSPGRANGGRVLKL